MLEQLAVSSHTTIFTPACRSLTDQVSIYDAVSRVDAPLTGHDRCLTARFQSLPHRVSHSPWCTRILPRRSSTRRAHIANVHSGMPRRSAMPVRTESIESLLDHTGNPYKRPGPSPTSAPFVETIPSPSIAQIQPSQLPTKLTLIPQS